MALLLLACGGTVVAVVTRGRRAVTLLAAVGDGVVDVDVDVDVDVNVDAVVVVDVEVETYVDVDKGGSTVCSMQIDRCALSSTAPILPASFQNSL